MEFFIVLCRIAFLVFLIWLNWFIAKQFSDIAAEKGFLERRNFWIPFFFEMVGYIMVVAMPDRGEQTTQVSDEEKDTSPKASASLFKDSFSEAAPKKTDAYLDEL